ncbi:efflux RND transporter periplasmic adaptor subunit [Shewanella cyperi]|uniref:Efflux RND transporter periplasmic adaptor subunit n=1 Tax=Shewanella cyperi TaxID=2814292 RepID=A0A974XJB2_9GAMM|nr:efflux RND transporter periplasmic adaptor subunit [Shewanella cyperi]QSX29419.1 efflux RND transporter periplasmic adaptor subunit [Shewanella cyperi]
MKPCETRSRTLSGPGLLLSLLMPLLLLSGNALAAKERPRPVKVMQISLADGSGERVLPGQVKASERAALSFQVSGEISAIKVRPGEAVKAGQLLALLDPAIYEQQLEVAKAQFELAKVLFERASSLVEQGVVSRNDFDKYKSDYAVARAALDKAETDLSYTRLLAPYDGIISQRFRRQYEFVPAQQQVLGIRNEAAIDVSFQLPEQYIGALQRSPQGQGKVLGAEVRFDSSDLWFSASLKEMNTVADISTASYTLVLTLPMPEKLNILPGMSAAVKVRLAGDGMVAQPALPEGALVREDKGNFVYRWLPAAHKVEKVAVTLNGTVLVSGLSDGDFVVVAGVDELSDGQTVERWVKERGL